MTPLVASSPGPLSLLSEAAFRRVWLTGGLVSIVRWIEFLTIGVYVFEVTRSASLVVLFTMLRLVPMALLGAVVGAVAEQVSRRGLLLGVVGCGIVVTAAQAVLAWTDRLELWHIALGALVSGVFWAVDMPVRRLILIELAGPGRTAPAMGLDAATNNATRMLGPTIGGLLLEFIGIHGAFALSACLYLCGFVMLRRLHLQETLNRRASLHILQQIREGMRIVASDRAMVGTLAVTVVFNVFLWPVTSMVPVIGQTQLHLSALPIGLLMSADGLGALAGAILVATRTRTPHFRGLYLMGGTLFACASIVFALSPWPLLSGAAQIAAGFGSACFATMQASIVFLSAPVAARSRAMGLVTVCIGTAAVIGFLHLRLLTDSLGAQWAMLASLAEGLVVLGLTVLFWPEVRPKAPFIVH